MSYLVQFDMVSSKRSSECFQTSKVIFLEKGDSIRHIIIEEFPGRVGRVESRQQVGHPSREILVLSSIGDEAMQSMPLINKY